MNTTYAIENEIERQRLSTIAARLTAEDFSRPLPNGWTVATKLAHLAFWDIYYLSCIEGWERTGFIASRANVDAINEAVRTLSRAISNESVVRLVRDAAEAIAQGGCDRDKARHIYPYSADFFLRGSLSVTT